MTTKLVSRVYRLQRAGAFSFCAIRDEVIEPLLASGVSDELRIGVRSWYEV